MSRAVSAQRERWTPAAHEHRLVAMRRLRSMSWSMPGTDDAPRQVVIADVAVIPSMGLQERIWRTQIVHSTGLMRELLRQPVGVWVVGEVVRGDRTGAWVLDDVEPDELDAIEAWLETHADELVLEGAEGSRRRADDLAEATREALQRGRGGAQ